MRLDAYRVSAKTITALTSLTSEHNVPEPPDPLWVRDAGDRIRVDELKSRRQTFDGAWPFVVRWFDVEFEFALLDAASHIASIRLTAR